MDNPDDVRDFLYMQRRRRGSSEEFPEEEEDRSNNREQMGPIHPSPEREFLPIRSREIQPQQSNARGRTLQRNPRESDWHENGRRPHSREGIRDSYDYPVRQRSIGPPRAQSTRYPALHNDNGRGTSRANNFTGGLNTLNSTRALQAKLFKVKQFPEGTQPSAQHEQWGYWIENFEMAIERVGDLPQREKAVELSLHIGDEIRKIISAKGLLASRNEVPADYPFYDDMVLRLSEHFKSLTDESVDVTLFDNIKQAENETIMQFDMRLQLLAKRINEKNLPIIRKRLLQGMSDKELADRAYIEGTKHEDVVKMACRKEALSKCRAEAAFPWIPSKPTQIIAAVQSAEKRPISTTPRQYGDNSAYDNRRSREQRPTPYSKNRVEFRMPRQGECNSCGINHGSRQCPATGKACHKCAKMGHFGYMCRKSASQEARQGHQSVRNVYEEENRDEVRQNN